MSRFLKRVLSVLIAAALLPCISAAAKTDSADSDEVRFLEALNIIKPDKHSDFLWDESPVKRGEMAEMLCNMLGIETETDETPRFVDTSDERRGYIETIVRNGYMSGYGDGRFGEEDYITNEQVIKIIVYMLGAESLATQYGGYPTGYLKAATEIGILRKGYPSTDAVARRIDVARLIYNAMHYEVLQTVSIKNGKPVYDITKGETFLTEMLDIYCYSGILKQNASTGIVHPEPLDENLVQIGDNVFSDKSNITEGMLGTNICVYVKKTDKDVYGEIIYAELNKNRIVTIDNKDIQSTSKTSVSYYDGSKQKVLKLSTVPDMVFNGTATDFDAAKLDVKDGFLKLIDNDDDGVYDVVLVTEYTTYVVDTAYPDEEIITMQYSEPLIELKDTKYSVYLDGEKAALSDLKKGYVLSVTKAENSEGSVYGIYASSKTLNGRVDIIKDSGKTVIIGGREYDLSNYYLAISDAGKTGRIDAGYAGVFSLNVKDEIVFGSQSAADNVAYLIAASIGDEPFEKKISVKLFTSKSKFEVFDFDDNTKVKINGEILKSANIADNKEFIKYINIKQLVTYTQNEGIIKSIELCGDTENKDDSRFSLDKTGTFDSTSNGILNYVYQVNNDTVVYVVPSNSDYYDNEAYYEVRNGSSIATSDNLRLMLYDVDEYGKVKYVVYSRDPQWTEIGNGNGVTIISSISEGINSVGNETVVFEGYGQSGDQVKFSTDDLDSCRKCVRVKTYDEDGNVSNVTISYKSDVSLKIGDVIQYKNNNKGVLHAFVLQHSVDEDKFYSQEKLEPNSKYSNISDVMYGRVLKNNGSSLLLNFSDKDSIGSDVDKTEQVVCNTGKAVYRVFDSSSGKKVEPIQFYEIMPGDRVYACIGSDNTTRILVVYD